MPIRRTARQIAEQFAIQFPEWMQLEMATGDTIQFGVDRKALPPITRYLRDEEQARFIVSVGTDRRLDAGYFEITNIFGLDQDQVFLLLRTEVDPADPKIPSITPEIHGANWAERELQDMLGVTAVGHPDPRRLVLPDDWPDGVHPLRKDFAYNQRPEIVPGRNPELKSPPEGSTLFPIGPFYPTLEEPVFINLFVHGEHIVGMDYRGFFAHRGIEKLGDAALTYQQVPFIAERICGICGFVHSSCYCQAAEKAAGIEIPPRARYIRTLLLELERIHSHLLWIGLACHFIGFDTLFMQAWRIREPVMWLTEYITGNRKTYGMNQIGGVARDLPEDAKDRILPVIERIAAEVAGVADAIVGDSSLALRLQGTGILSAAAARDLCVIGPTARGSGLDIDARRDHPFAAYGDMEFEVCVEQGGDNWARTMVRIRELSEAIKIARQVLDKIPAGPVMADFAEIPPGRVGVSSVEAPRGEVHHYVRTGAGQRPDRWRVRAPSFNNLQSIPALLQGMTIADAPISIGSLDPCFSCTERLGVVDQTTGQLRIYKQADLLAEFRHKRERRTR
jgi:Ni,Fe-hydrogenase III large subunit/Ni,Fe-hydrogenase III component G